VGRLLDCSARRFRMPLTRVVRDLRSFARMAWRMGIKNRAVRLHWWRTMLSTARENPRALRYVGAMTALYLHLGPFAQFVANRLEVEMERETESVAAPTSSPV